MTGQSDDERFAALIAAEFAEDVTDAPAPAERSAGTPPPGRDDAPAPSFGFRVWTPAEEPDEDFVPPPVPPAPRWHPQTVTGVALVCSALLLVVLSGFGVRLPTLVAVLAGAAFFGGNALLLYRLTKRPPSDDDGAVV